MASSGGHHPGRTLIILGVIVAAMFGIMALSKSWSPKLGLDLQGGTTITLTASNTSGQGQVDPVSLQLAQTIIQARVDSLGVGESEVTTSGANQLVVSVPNVQQDELVRLVGQTALLRFRLVYSETEVTPPATAEPTPSPSGSASPSSSPSGSPAASGTPSPAASPTTGTSVVPNGSPSPAASASAGVTPSGNSRPAPQLPTKPPAPRSPRPSEPGKGITPAKALDWEPSEQDKADFTSYTCETPRADFPDVSDQPLITCNKEKTVKFLLSPMIIEGSQLTSASAGVPQNQLNWVVNLEFNSDAAVIFTNVTQALSAKQSPQNQFAIVLDSEVISFPQVTTPIPGGRAQIEGSFNQKSASELANILKYGALPLAFEVSEVSNVSATLGGEQLHAGIIAGIIGLILVVGFCFLYYRGLGIVVVSSLLVAASITYAAMVLLGSSVGFALNLPGIAGAIVAIGVTADSFVIYFERIRDEVRDGRSLRTAVETGWRRARQTVLIADAVSMLSAVILFVLAIGSVKGFAFTLGLTTVIDVLVVFFFTKPLMTILARTKFFGGGHRLSGLDPGHLGVKALPGSRTRRVGRRQPVSGGGI